MGINRLAVVERLGLPALFGIIGTACCLKQLCTYLLIFIGVDDSRKRSMHSCIENLS